MEKKPLLITDTILRDAHQSQAATRMRLEDMLPALEKLDKIGYWSVECWGGATFDVCMRFLNGPVGEASHDKKAHAEHKASDAFPRSEHFRIQALRRRCR